MTHTLLNNTDEYLLSQRERNNQDIARVLRKYMKHFMIRDKIPIDEAMYTDYLKDDLRQMHLIAHRVIERLDKEMSDYPRLKQLDLFFGKE